MKKKRGIKGQRVKPPTPARVIYVFIGDEEQNEKPEKFSYPGLFGSLLQPARIMQRAYFFNPTGGKKP